MNHYPRHVGDITRATYGLSLAELGAYDRLLDWYYAEERPIPADRAEVARISGARTAVERKAVDYVLNRFFSLTDGFWRQKRADEELDIYRQKSESAREAALLSVASRARSRDEVNRELRKSRMQAAREKGTHTSEQWDDLLAKCGRACVRCGAKEMPLERDHITPVYQGGSDGIENIQPVCAECNSSKGPEAIDYRPLSVRSAFAQPTLSERSTSHKPVASSQEPIATSQSAPSEPPKVKNASGARKTAPADPAKGAETWTAYSGAFERRYGVPPVRNRKANSLMAQLVDRLGATEAPVVAAHFLRSNRQLYVAARHALDLLIRDAEAIRTDWATGTSGTETQARQADRTAAVGNTFAKLIDERSRNGTEG